MSQERQDNSIPECLLINNVNYCETYMSWIVPKVYGRVCDIGSGIGYPTERYALKDEVSIIYTNDKFYDENKTIKHDKIIRFVATTEQFLKLDMGLFDTIVSTEHIEHLEIQSQIDLLNYVVKNLKNDGVFLGSMPNVDCSDNQYHIQEYTSRQWNRILKRYFSDVEVVVLTSELYVWKAKK